MKRVWGSRPSPAGKGWFYNISSQLCGQGAQDGSLTLANIGKLTAQKSVMLQNQDLFSFLFPESQLFNFDQHTTHVLLSVVQKHI